MKKLWMSWSTGKDSAHALAELQRRGEYEVTGLFTTMNEAYERVAMHSTRRELLERQAQALGLPVETVMLPADCTNEEYEAQFAGVVSKARDAGVSAFGFGDLFLSDVRAYRERTLAGTGIEPVFPLWQRPTNELAEEMISAGIEAVFTCIDPKKLSRDFAGAAFDRETIRAFPPGVDPCGENGEFHSFVLNSPLFKQRLAVTAGAVVERGGFVFADVLPT
jgi:uncharacterized protein (TIGR00290 family)